MKNIAITLKSKRGWVVFLLGSALLALSVVSTGAVEKDRSMTVVQASEHKDGGGYLGIMMQELSKDIREGLALKSKQGVLVSDIIDGSPADKAGLQEGDVIIEYDGKKVDSPTGLKDLVSKTETNKKVRVKYIRDSETKTVQVTIAEWPEDDVFGFTVPDDADFDMEFLSPGDLNVRMLHRGRLGVRVSDINEDLSSYFKVDEGKGVLVLEVYGESTAQKVGVKAGDVIVKLDDRDIGSVPELQKQVADVDSGDEFDLTVVRKGKKMTLEGKMEKDDWAARQYGKLKKMRVPHWRSMRPHIEKFRWSDRDELREEIEDLKKELEKLREDLEKMKS
jgi:serine protease Do